MADENETADKYSISEWWIEPNVADQVHTITKTMTEYSTAWKAPHQYLSATNGSMWKKEHF
ncbi:hypothetical protein [Chryseolinea sp. H1M3-3]|uniref:hypothetical protein n=1 Tax=Chryseolinea sp. H1M3-3 TaxID=3034144 RepID=UPI0023EB8109|nr:hypothetical protein [Chryseolinea sp. H1M3-3]